ncbi:hypothetical protein AAHE18_02G076200 [Arachis hypogaea]
MKIQQFLSLLVISICVVAGLCVKDEQQLLLQLKNNLTFNFNSGRSSKLNVWNQSIGCCNWSGVTCNDEGYVIGLDLSGESITGGFNDSSSLFGLQHLQKLNLAANNFNSMIPSAFGLLDKLTYLNLSHAGFVGQIPIEISQLTRLVTLDISSVAYFEGQYLKLENPNLRMLIRNLSSIRQLYLDGVIMTSQAEEWCNALLFLPNLQELSMSHCNLSGPLNSSLTSLENLSVIRLDRNNFSSPVPETFATLKNLTILSLSVCRLTGVFPQKIFQVRTLSFIDISYNSNLQGSFPVLPFNGSLHTLIVSNTNFSGELPSSIGSMTQLSALDLFNCQFRGKLPISLSKLAELSYLDLSLNNFTGPVPSFGKSQKLTYIDLSRNNFSGPIPSSTPFEVLQNLISINLAYNSISGRIPSSLFRLPLLKKILLSNNQFVQLDELTNVSSSKLNTLDLSSNNLSGPIPMFIFQLRELSIIQLSSNKFNGPMQLDEFLALKNLTTLDLSYNNLFVNVSLNLSSIPNISMLKLASCNLKTIPGFLRYQSGLAFLDLSDNQIQGSVPNWIWKLKYLQSLNMSHNFLTDFQGPLQNLSSNLAVLDLHHNQLRGIIPVFPKYAAYVDYSNNNFSSIIPVEIGSYLSGTFYLSLANNRFHGSIPNSICDASFRVLDLSRNNISGTIPFCLIALSKILGVLNLRNNKLSGPIHDLFPASCALRTLDLHGNILEGHIPKSLANCSTLEVWTLGTIKFLMDFHVP